MCPDCRTVSQLGLICRGCASELRETDSPLVSAPLPVATGILCLLLLVLGVAQVLGPGLARHLAYAPFTTLVEPWRILTGPFSEFEAYPLLATVLSVIAFGAVASSVETTRGILAMLVTALITNTAGYAGAYLLAATGSAEWYTGLVGPWAAVAGLGVSGLCGALKLGRSFCAILATAGLLAAAVMAWFAAPAVLIPVAAATAAAAVIEVVRAFFHRPQRAMTPLAVSSLVAMVLVLAAFLVRGLLG